MRINLNDNVRFIPTREGALLWNKSGAKPWASPGQTVESQLRVLFVVFGPNMRMGGYPPIEGHAVDVVEGAPSPEEENGTPDPPPALGNVHGTKLASEIHRRLVVRYHELDESPTVVRRRTLPRHSSQIVLSVEVALRVIAEELAAIRMLKEIS